MAPATGHGGEQARPAGIFVLWVALPICRSAVLLNQDVILMADISAPVAVWRSVRALPEFWRLLELRTVCQFGDGLFQAGLAGALLFNPEAAASPAATTRR